MITGTQPILVELRTQEPDFELWVRFWPEQGQNRPGWQHLRFAGDCL